MLFVDFGALWVMASRPTLNVCGNNDDVGDGEAVADDDGVDDQRDEVVCTVCDRMTCIAAPPAVQVCITSNCLRWVCWVPLGWEIFWESDICNETVWKEREKRKTQM